MRHFPPHAAVSHASRRRLARGLVGLSIRDIEQDVVLETLIKTRGNRTLSARLLGFSIRTLRNKIAEYTAQGIEVPRHKTQNDVSSLFKLEHGAGPIPR